jgi:DNA-binding PadR family transcriptional regulator
VPRGPLNIGQVYTTLSRLERDELVARAGEDDDGRALYRITDPGRQVVRDWFSTPVERGSPPRDELAIKLAVAVSVVPAEVPAIVQRQRTHTMRALQDYTRLKTDGGARANELAWLLVLEALIFQAEAESGGSTTARHASRGPPAHPPARPVTRSARKPASRPARFTRPLAPA